MRGHPSSHFLSFEFATRPRRFALGSIFINYRRSDSEGEAGRLFDDLTSRFHDKSIFMDVAAIEPGRDFRKAIDKSVADCSVLLAIIGHEWLESKDALGRRRLDDPNDFVRIELASALRRDIPVVPILVRGTKMPNVEQLPDDLKDLAYRNAVELTHARWKSDVHVLVEALTPYLDLDKSGPDTSAHDSENAAKPSNVQGKEVSPAKSHETASSAVMIDPKTIERLGRELATFIGPISDLVVKRAAKRCSSVEELCEMLAREVESEANRAKFLRSCRSM